MSEQNARRVGKFSDMGASQHPFSPEVVVFKINTRSQLGGLLKIVLYTCWLIWTGGGIGRRY